jgi:hypothetical protein
MKSQVGREVLPQSSPFRHATNYTLLDAIKLTKQSKGILILRNPVKRNTKAIEFYET